MTGAPEGDEFVSTAPGTIAGRYMRQYWQPVFESDRLGPGRAVPIEVMSERFTLYRAESGEVHMVSPSCPHRGTPLALGEVEGETIRCRHHGWRFDASGRCVEQPAEPQPFCAQAAIQSYPAREQMGLIFGYFGPLPAPPLPQWPELESECHVASMAMLPCNYFQSAENIVDYAHASFVHRPISRLDRTAQGRAARVEESQYGLRIYDAHLEGREGIHYMMPNMAYVSYCLGNVVPDKKSEEHRMQSLFWYVPVDDVSHMHVMVTAGVPEIIQVMREERNIPHSVVDDVMSVLNESSDLHRDRERVLRRPDMVRLQDGVTIVGQGAIADRSREWLGAIDAGVVLLRRLWRRELSRVAIEGGARRFLRPASLG